MMTDLVGTRVESMLSEEVEMALPEELQSLVQVRQNG